MTESNQHAPTGNAPPPRERTLPVVILGELIVLPGIPVSLQVGSGKSYRAIEAALGTEHDVLLVFVREADIDAYRQGTVQHLPPVGVVARLEDTTPVPDGTISVVLHGVARAEITTLVQHEPFYRATCVPHADPERVSPEGTALMDSVKAQLAALMSTMPGVPPEAVAVMQQTHQLGQLADMAAYGPMFAFADRLDVLQVLDPLERLRTVQRKLAA